MRSITVLAFIYLQICRSFTMNGISYSVPYFKRIRRDDFSQVNRNGRTQEASSGKNVPNPWLYKFPPWYFPINPPPDGFVAIDSSKNTISVVDDNSAEDRSSSIENSADGDVIIVPDFIKNDRQGRLLNVKIPGDTIYRDEVVKTIVDFSLGKFPKVKYRPGNDGVIIDQPALLTKEPQAPGIVVQNGISIQDLTPTIGTNDRPNIQQSLPLQTTNPPLQTPNFQNFNPPPQIPNVQNFNPSQIPNFQNTIPPSQIPNFQITNPPLQIPNFQNPNPSSKIPNSQKSIVNVNQNNVFGVTKPHDSNRNPFSNQNNVFAVSQHLNSNRNPIPNKTNGFVINHLPNNIRNQTPKPTNIFVNQPHSNNKNKLPGNIRITNQFVNEKPASQSFTSTKDPDIGSFRPSPPDISLNSIQPQFNSGSFQSSNYYGFQPSSIPLAGIVGGAPNSRVRPPAQTVPQLRNPEVHPSTFQLKTPPRVTNPTPFAQHTLRGTIRVSPNHSQLQQGVTSTYAVLAQQNGGSNGKVRLPGAFPQVQQGNRGSVSTVKQRPNSFRQAKPQIHNNYNSQRVRYQNNKGGPQVLSSQRGHSQFTIRRPTSIQDIIRSNHDNSPVLQSRERGNEVSSSVITSRPSRHRANPVTQRNNWRWPSLS